MSRTIRSFAAWFGLVWVLTAYAEPAHTSACAANAPSGWATLAQGVHVWMPAPDAEPSPSNLGHVMPTSVLVHGAKAWVIDPGPSVSQSQRLVEHIRCAWGAEVRVVINTHAHAENVLGNAGFADALSTGRLQVMASTTTAMTMKERCPVCLADLTQRVGDLAMHGTHIVLPTQMLRHGDVLAFGPHRLQVHEITNAHTANDLVLWHSKERIAFVGGLVYGLRLPELAQGSLMGWRLALDTLRALPARWVVGATVSGGGLGHAQQTIESTDAYLAHLQQAVLQGMEWGLQVSEIAPRADSPFDAWAGNPERHSFNLQRAWRELEPAWMDGALSPNP